MSIEVQRLQDRLLELERWTREDEDRVYSKIKELEDRIYTLEQAKYSLGKVGPG